jgi:hypothetical protein
MFLVEDKRYGTTYLVFTAEDPTKDEYTRDVVEGVSLDYDMEAVHSWPDGHPRPEPSVGRAKDDPKRYKVFKYSSDRQSAGYEPVTGTVLVFGSWSDYVRLHLDPPNPELIDDERWYEYLDKLDEASRLRRQRVQALTAPTSGNRDEVAAWLAKKHLIVDSAIREVWYLPQGSPPDEIRLLEVNDRLAGSESKVEAVDFGLDVEGAPLRLFVADLTSDQLAQIRQDPSRLPAGWSLGGATNWSRRGA